MNAGLSRGEARRAIDYGWTEREILSLHLHMQGDYTTHDGLTIKDFQPWGILLNSQEIFYRGVFDGDLESSFMRGASPGLATAYTDGSGTVATKSAGIGAVVYQEGHKPLFLSENIGNGTNNRAELLAIWMALRSLPNVNKKIHVFSDSQYSIGALTETWNATANAEVIAAIRLDLSWRNGNVTFEHCPGHDKVEGNEIADKLAGMGRKWVKHVSIYPGYGAWPTPTP